ncbi:MAG: hypothetical protein QOI47_1786, partial [Actinomycetota bacterium]|nr:hypothetical protein [Actinomycetota bacterium]
TRAARRLAELLDGELVTTDVVVMEVLMGARDDVQLRMLKRLMNLCQHTPVEQADYEEAAALWRACRRAGQTPSTIADCLIATVAVRVGVPLLHNDRDYDVIARHVGLVIDT